ncbi:MAG: hypothetical protein K5872_22020 [Rhizobiaceae bacterium]|nr:hypothetical protein [Rhizobiaceae bacterium]MCV0408897.1 hypothetical protein [Rhizobiaceae bacterium]
MTTFRVFFTDGDALDVDAKNPNAARDIARDQKGGGIVSKVKRLKGA